MFLIGNFMPRRASASRDVKARRRPLGGCLEHDRVAMRTGSAPPMAVLAIVLCCMVSLSAVCCHQEESTSVTQLSPANSSMQSPKTAISTPTSTSSSHTMAKSKHKHKHRDKDKDHEHNYDQGEAERNQNKAGAKEPLSGQAEAIELSASQPDSDPKLELATEYLLSNEAKLRLRRNSKETSTRLVGLAGQTVELRCPLANELLQPTTSSNSDHRASIVWRKNGTKLGSQFSSRIKLNPSNGSLVILSAQPKFDDSTYECGILSALASASTNQTNLSDAQSSPGWASTDAGSKHWHKFQLKLLVAPKLAPFEAPQDAQVGMKVVLTCSILEAQQPISFVWLKDNQIIADNLQRQHHSSSAVNSQLLSQLHRQQLADKLASSDGSMSMSSATSGSGSGASSQEALFQYTVVDHLEPVASSIMVATGSQQQQQQEQILPILSDPAYRVRQADDYSILTIDGLELRHSGRYTCSAQNEAARSSHSSQLVINAPPTFSAEPKDVDIVSGQSVVIDCAAVGHPRPTILWHRAREAQAQQWDYVPIYDSLRYSSLANGSLAISNVTQREQGYYLCSAKNGFGVEISKLVKVTVHEPARFTSRYKSLEVRLDDKASMVCMATGELPVHVEWLDKLGNPITSGNKKFIVDNEPHDLRASTAEAANGSISRLILTKSEQSDSGHYTCQATNKFGSDKMVINLLVQDVPDRVTDLMVTNVTATTISLRWQLGFTGNSPITSYMIQYQSDDPLDDLLASMSSSAAVMGGHATPTPPITGDSSQAGNSNSNLNLNLNTNSNSNSLMSVQSTLKAAIEALNSGSSSDAADDIIDRSLVELTVKSSHPFIVVKELSPYCVYRLRLAAINKIGLGEFSDWIRAKTDEAPPSGSALKMLATPTGPNSIKLAWTPPDRRTWNGQLIGFNIGYRPKDSAFEFNKTLEWSPPSLLSIMQQQHQQTDSGTGDLQRHQAQHALHQELRSLVNAINGPNSSAASSTSSPSTTTGADLTGALSAGNRSSLSQQQVASQQRQSSRYNLRQHLRQWLALQQQESVAHLTNLQRSTTYLIWLQAINSRGFGPQSHAISVKTLEDVPPSAPALKVQSTGPGSITIAWSLLSNFVSSANQYSLFYRKLPANPAHMSRLMGANASQLAAAAAGAPQATLFYPPSSSASSSSALDAGASGGPFEAGAYLERTIGSQQLLFAGNLFLGADQEGPRMGDASLGGPKPTFLQQQQAANNGQPQHYQQFVYTLDQLECGTTYELYMTTRNSVGKSEPSTLVTTRTLGEPPLLPANKNNLFAKIASSELVLNLASWSSGGCPFTHMRITYKLPMTQQLLLGPRDSSGGPNNLLEAFSRPQSNSSMAVTMPISLTVPASLLGIVNSANKQHPSSSLPTSGQEQLPIEQSPLFTLRNLVPSSCYELEILAENGAGFTRAQYEFVTANINDTRPGYSRKDRVFRVDWRGLVVGTGGAGSGLESASNLNHGGRSQFGSDGHEHAPMGAGSAMGPDGAAAQVLPFVLMLVCLVSVVTSLTFCFHRFREGYHQAKQRTSDPDGGNPRRPNSADTMATSGPGAFTASPGSVGKSSMWRIHYGSTQAKQVRRPDSSVVADDSPLHYCGAHQSGSTLHQNGGSQFSQSVSMRDFGLAGQALHTPTHQNHPELNHLNQQQQPHHATTLNLRNYRSSMRPQQRAGTLRARLVQESSAGKLASNTLRNYGQHQGKLRHQVADSGALFGAHQQAGRLSEPSGVQYGGMHELYGPASRVEAACEPGQQHQQETSWTNYVASQPKPSNYAIPNGGVSCMDAMHGQKQLSGNNETICSGQLGGYIDQLDTVIDGQPTNDTYGIDACIQHLVNQHLQQQQQLEQQQQQHQQYAIILNQSKSSEQSISPGGTLQSPPRCLYPGDYSTCPQPTGGYLQQQHHHPMMGGVDQSGSLASQLMGAKHAAGSSVVDSSGSSSSGIDVGAHSGVESASNVTGTTSASLNGSSQNGYEMQAGGGKLMSCSGGDISPGAPNTFEMAQVNGAFANYNPNQPCNTTTTNSNNIN